MILPQLFFHTEPRDESSVFTHPTSTLCYSSYLALSIWRCWIWQSLTCGKSVIIVASCCNPGSLRSLFRLVVYNYIVLFIIVTNKTATTDIRLNHLIWTALTGLGFFPDIYDHFALSRPPPTSAAYNTSETSLLIGPMYGPVINASLMYIYMYSHGIVFSIFGHSSPLSFDGIAASMWLCKDSAAWELDVLGWSEQDRAPSPAMLHNTEIFISK